MADDNSYLDEELQENPKDRGDHVLINKKDYCKLLEYGLDEKVVRRLAEIYKTGKLEHGELDKRVLNGLNEMQVDDALYVLYLLQPKLGNVINKSAYLWSLIQTYKYKRHAISQGEAQPAAPAEVTSTINDQIRNILKRTGYSLTVTTRQRQYGGPPPNWYGPAPGSNCKIFCNLIPKDVFEDILIPLFEDCGTIWELALIINPITGRSRGYAFITFTKREAAVDAVRQLDNHEIKPGKHLKIEIEKQRLFVGNIPMSKSKEMIFSAFDQITTGLEEVIVYNTPDMNRKNRGYCFLDYRTHAAASLAKKRLGIGAFKVWGRYIVVDWADPLQEFDEQTMAKVKSLYVRNLSHEATEDKLKEQFGQYGEVERVKKIKDFAFVHFENRDNALEAMENVTGIELGSPFLHVSLARPPQEKKKREEILRERNRRLLQECPNLAPSTHPIHQRGGYQPPLRPTMAAPNNYNYRNYPEFQGCFNHFPKQSSHYQYPTPQTADGSRGGFRGRLEDTLKRTQATQTGNENFLDAEEVRASFVGAQFAKPQQNLRESINLYEYGGYKATHYTDFSLFDEKKFTSKSIATATQSAGDKVRASEGGTQLTKPLQDLAKSIDSLEYRDEHNAIYPENFSLFRERKCTFKYSLSAEEGIPETAGGLRHNINQHEDSSSKESAIAKVVTEQIEN